VWHVSVWPPSRTRAEAVLSGVGAGALFDEPGVHTQILHLRQRMTTDQVKQLAGTRTMMSARQIQERTPHPRCCIYLPRIVVSIHG